VIVNDDHGDSGVVGHGEFLLARRVDAWTGERRHVPESRRCVHFSCGDTFAIGVEGESHVVQQHLLVEGFSTS